MVYVLNMDGNPLMPTIRHGKVRRMLKAGLAAVVKRTPFTIKLLYETENNVQEISLGIDAGSKTIGASATTDKAELYAAEISLRNDIVSLLASRREARRARRYRKTRYRKTRFLNRRNGDGWLAPSIRNKVEAHLREIEDVRKILPVSKIVIETASFDIQKIKNPEITGTEYQEGEQSGFWNVREYVLFRDGHMCQCCKGKSKDKILNVHHIESRKTGGDAPNNLITLCETCHNGFHAGTVTLPKTIRRGMAFRDAAFMGIMRWAFHGEAKRLYEPLGITVKMTFGYITKHKRIEYGLPKAHSVDARCISGNPAAVPAGFCFYKKRVRNHNRQLHKFNILKGGLRKNNKAPYLVKGFRLFDKVRCHGEECFIFGRRSSGRFDVRRLDGTKISAGISYKKLKFLEPGGSILTERRTAIPLTFENVSFLA